MKRTLSLVAVIALLSVPAAAFAQGRGGRGGGPDGPRGARMAERAKDAGVSDATITKIKAIVDKNREGMKDLRGEKQEARDALHDLMQADKPNSKKIMEQIELLGHIRTELQKKRVGMQLEIRKLVTSSQWDAMRPGRGGKGMRGQRGRGGRGRGMGRGGRGMGR